MREIERWTTADGGKSWKSEAVTAGSKFDNVRPFVVNDHEPDGPTVLWMNLHGRYVHFTDYLTAIKMDRPAKTTGTQVAEILSQRAAVGEDGSIRDWGIE